MSSQVRPAWQAGALASIHGSARPALRFDMRYRSNRHPGRVNEVRWEGHSYNMIQIPSLLQGKSNYQRMMPCWHS